MEYSLELLKKKKSITCLFSRYSSSINLRGVAAKSVLVPPCDNIGGVYIPLSGYLSILSLQLLAQPHRTRTPCASHAVHEHYPTEACKPGPRKCIYMHRGRCISSASYGMRWRCTVILLDKRRAAR